MPIVAREEIAQVAIDSIKNYTTIPYELIEIPNRDKKLGWCKAINQGLKEMVGNYIVFANDDIVVTPHWAEKMLEHFKANKELGVLGTTSNKVDSLQHITFNKDGLNFQYTDYLTFFFVMIKREVIDKIGGLDKRFDPGGQDDMDYCIRAKKAGFEIGIARDVFIYHYGSASFRDVFSIPQSKEFAKSRQRLLAEKYPNLNSRKRIFIAIPNQGEIVSELATNLLYWTHDPKYQIKVFMPKNIFPLDAARNRCVKEFLETDYQYLWWIDDDIVPPRNALDKLIDADKDIIGAVCFAMKYENDKALPYPVTLRYNEESKYVVYYGSGIEEVDATGGACVLFKRKVYETIERPYEFHYHKDGTLSLTCDFDIFQKVQKAGFKIYIDFDLLCAHIRTVDIMSLQNYLVRMKNG